MSFMQAESGCRPLPPPCTRLMYAAEAPDDRSALPSRNSVLAHGLDQPPTAANTPISAIRVDELLDQTGITLSASQRCLLYTFTKVCCVFSLIDLAHNHVRRCRRLSNESLHLGHIIPFRIKSQNWTQRCRSLQMWSRPLVIQWLKIGSPARH